MRAKFVPTSRLLFAGKQLSSLGKRSVERSLWLCVVRLTTLSCDFSHRRGSRGRRRYRKTAWAEKTVRKRSFDTCRCRVVFPGTHHMRYRRITEMSVIVHALPNIKTILYKRPSPTERKFRKVGLCTFLSDVICMQHQMVTYTLVG